MEAVHLSTFDTVQCKNELLARALGSRHSIYIGDMVLRYDGQELKAFQLKKDHVPTTLVGQLPEPIRKGSCEDYLQQGIRLGTYHKISALFPLHYLHKDFDEVELGASSWQPKLDAIQEQLDDLDSTYASDAEVVAAFAEQIAAAGDIFTLVTNKVQVETTRATQAEQALISDVAQNEQDGDDDRALIRQQYVQADAVVNAAVVAEAALARQEEQAIQQDVNTNESVATADRQDIRDDYVAADAVVNQAVVTEAAAARAAEGVNTTAIGVERARIDTIISLPTAALNNFAAIQAAYEAADQSADSALTALVTSKVASADLDTLVSQVDAVEANTLKRDNAAQDVRYYQKGDVDSAVGLRVLQTDFDNAIGARQTTAAQELAYRKISESLSKTDAEAADNARVLTATFDSAINARQTTNDQEAAYRKKVNSLSKTDAEAADNARVLTTTFQGAIDDRQTTSVADGKYRLQSDSYDKTEVDARDTLRVLTTTFQSAIDDRQTTAAQEAAYRKISNSHPKADVYTKTAADAEFHTQAYVAGQLALKQNVVQDDHLQISHTDGLQDALNAKQATVGADDLQISHTDGLQDALDAKQATVVNDALAIAHTSGLQDALDARATAAAPTLTGAVQIDSHTVIGSSGPDQRENHAAKLLIRNHNDSGVTITCPNDKRDFICFGSYNDADQHHIVAYHQDTGNYKNGLHFKAGGGDGEVECLSMTKQSSANRVGIDKRDPEHTLDVNGTSRTSSLIVTGASKLQFGQTPAFNDVGEIGQIQFDDNYIYVCTTGGTWKRAAIAAWS